MKTGIHPEYVVSHVTCTCGNDFYTRSTQSEIHVEVCAQCHPFYTGRQKIMDTGGRIDRFKRRQARAAAVEGEDDLIVALDFVFLGVKVRVAGRAFPVDPAP